MQDKSQTFIWSDGWWIEGSKGWFVDGMENTLFCVDMNTGECEKAVCIPDEGNGTYRLNPYCVKYGRDIYCIPLSGHSIWIYNLDIETFTELNIKKLPERQPRGSQYWVVDDMIYIVLGNWNRIIEVDTVQRIISNYYIICENDNVWCSTLADGKICALSFESGKIYQFDLLTKEVKTYVLPDTKKRLTEICYDGERFWLSGYENEVYVWNSEDDNFAIINFSEIFQVNYTDHKTEYTTDKRVSPVFNRIIAVGGYIWFIPIQARKIMYVDKQTAKVSVLDIYEEDIISDTIKKKQGIGNYLLEYVWNDRYIGLFSAQNGCILEIDTKKLIYHWKEYYFSEQCMQQRLQQYCKMHKGIYLEGNDLLCAQAYHMHMEHHIEVFGESRIDNVGMAIYTRLIKESMQ